MGCEGGAARPPRASRDEEGSRPYRSGARRGGALLGSAQRARRAGRCDTPGSPEPGAARTALTLGCCCASSAFAQPPLCPPSEQAAQAAPSPSPLSVRMHRLAGLSPCLRARMPPLSALSPPASRPLPSAALHLEQRRPLFGLVDTAKKLLGLQVRVTPHLRLIPHLTPRPTPRRPPQNEEDKKRAELNAKLDAMVGCIPNPNHASPNNSPTLACPLAPLARRCPARRSRSGS